MNQNARLVKTLVAIIDAVKEVREYLTGQDTAHSITHAENMITGLCLHDFTDQGIGHNICRNCRITRAEMFDEAERKGEDFGEQSVFKDAKDGDIRVRWAQTVNRSGLIRV